MGDDFCVHKVFTGDVAAHAIRDTVIEAIVRSMAALGLRQVDHEAEVGRNFCIGPAEHWIHVGDSVGSSEDDRPPEFEMTAMELSRIAPVVDFVMSDSALFEAFLYRSGIRVDYFRNIDCFWGQQPSPDKLHGAGLARLWSDVIAPGRSVNDLKYAFERDGRATSVYRWVSDALGLPHKYDWVGYTFDADGVPEKCDSFLRDTDGFSELHFKR